MCIGNLVLYLVVEWSQLRCDLYIGCGLLLRWWHALDIMYIYCYLACQNGNRPTWAPIYSGVGKAPRPILTLGAN